MTFKSSKAVITGGLSPRLCDIFPRSVVATGIAFALGLVMLQSPVQAQSTTAGHAGHGGHAAHSEYAGQQNREITTLSPDDMSQLNQGQGWGLAKPAELNGVPGPVHLLELADDIGLSDSQRDALERMVQNMRRNAIELGQQYIEAERALDSYFKAGEFSDAKLKKLVQDSANAFSSLRHLHLSFHDQTLKVITPDQAVKYNELRGYEVKSGQSSADAHERNQQHQHSGAATSAQEGQASQEADPCAAVPAGHDPAMYRKHMGCPSN